MNKVIESLDAGESMIEKMRIDPKYKEGLIEQIGALITSGIESWVEAGTIIATILDDDPNSIGMIIDKTGLDEHIIMRFYSLGKRGIHPLMLCSSAPGIKRLA